MIPEPTLTAGPPAPARKLPGLAGIWIGVVLIVVGIVVGIALIVSGFRAVIDSASDLQRVPIYGGSVYIDDPGEQSVYLERASFDTGSGFSTGTTSFAPVVTVLVTDPNGAEVLVQRRISNEQYTWNGVEGVRIASFDAATAGSYQVSAIRPDDLGPYNALAVGNAIDFDGIKGVLLGVFGGGFIVLVGVVVIIISAVRRSRAKRRAAPPTPFGGPGGPGAPGGAWAGGPGWAPPPVPAPGGYAPGSTWSPPPPQQTWPPAPTTAPGWVPPPAPPPPQAPGSPPGAPPQGEGPIS